tara:strand:+ start:629 stop:850 length:222 start_codon:yes stop_codon:yes gene_type:complete
MKKKVLDISNEKCPMTFLKAKLFIKDNVNTEKTIIVKGKKNMLMLQNSLKKNFKIITKPMESNKFQLNLYDQI